MARTINGKIVTQIGYANYQELYLDWVNNFLTTEGFASHHNIDTNIASSIIEEARYLYGKE